VTKGVVSSDWHGDFTTHGVDRFSEIETAAHRTVDVAIEENADFYAFLGDLCDPDSGSCVFRVAKLALDVALRLRSARIPSIWLAGNHDVIESGRGDSSLTPMRALEEQLDDFVYVAERPKGIQIDHLYVACLPFTASSHPYDPEKALGLLMKDADERGRDVKSRVVIGHLNVPGVIPGEETTEMPRGREVVFPSVMATKGADLVMHGHYHRKQKTNDGIWIPGSLARLTFGEESHEPGYLVVNV
jgi:DNA repair exonuclease SbcCD nuclease subunit